MSLALGSRLRLNNNTEIPRLGLGVFRAGAGGGTRDAVRWALEAGYRHIDTAAVYRNEVEVGEAIRESGIPREDLFVTTKLWREQFGFEEARRAFDASLQKLGLDYVDLYLLHWPQPETREPSWRALEVLHAEGRAKAIGVSNFMPQHLEPLLQTAKTIPAVNQIELHPFHQQPKTVEFCEAHSIAIEAWSPLTKAQRLDDPTVSAIAREVDRSSAQVLIRWSLQRGFVVLPKSANEARIRENAEVFDFTLSHEQMQQLDGLEEGYRSAPGWDPSDVA